MLPHGEILIEIDINLQTGRLHSWNAAMGWIDFKLRLFWANQFPLEKQPQLKTGAATFINMLDLHCF